MWKKEPRRNGVDLKDDKDQRERGDKDNKWKSRARRSKDKQRTKCSLKAAKNSCQNENKYRGEGGKGADQLIRRKRRVRIRIL